METELPCAKRGDFEETGQRSRVRSLICRTIKFRCLIQVASPGSWLPETAQGTVWAEVSICPVFKAL